MKEWIIRLLCVLLGVAITLGTTNVIEVYGRINDNRQLEELKLDEVDDSQNDLEALAKTEEGNEEEVIQDYELEAKLKYEKMMEEEAALSDRIDSSEDEILEEIETNVGVNSEVIEYYAPSSIESAPVRWKRDYPTLNSETTLEEKLAARSSYDETMAVNALDRLIIENSEIDFSDVKITIIGDSITAGNTLSEEEKDIYNWPAQLKEILGCKEVVNLGVGGSPICRCVDNFPMVDRWEEITYDSDIIIIMGGSNDMLFESNEQFGEVDFEHRFNRGTFCGDLDEMLGGIETTYRDYNEENYCKLIYINPPATVLNDAVYATDPDNMVRQSRFAEAINVIAQEHGFEVIDLYNNNILNSNDMDINATFVNDGIHCNKEGYRILAQHVASQLIQRIEP